MLAACSGVVVASASFFVACSDKARLPSETQNDRIYTCDDVVPEPVRLGGDTFAELYRDIFSTNGVAKCQTSTCHGNGTGPGGNGMAMYPSKVKAPLPGKPPLTNGDPSLAHDDRALYCGLTSHRYQRGTHLDPCPDPTGVECSCVKDNCQCASGPNAGKTCCAPDPKATNDVHCDADAATKKTSCWNTCGRLVVDPHPDGSDSTPTSALLEVLSPKDGAQAFMPQLFTCGGNRKLLPEELARVASWLKRGAPYDGATLQPAYDCPDPVEPQ